MNQHTNQSTNQPIMYTHPMADLQQHIKSDTVSSVMFRPEDGDKDIPEYVLICSLVVTYLFIICSLFVRCDCIEQCFRYIRNGTVTEFSLTVF